MKHRLMIVILVGVFCLLGADMKAAITDPYEIINRCYQASGGLDKLKTQKTSYVEGKIIIVGAGIEGTFSKWSEIPIKSRQDVDLKVMKVVSGDNGDYAWSVDANGKVQIARDSVTLKQRRIQELYADYDHLNRDSKNFRITYVGTDTAGGSVCYAVRIANTINTDTVLNYYDTTGFLLKKSVSINPEGENITWYSDYRPVDGILNAFRQDALSLPTGQRQTVEMTKFEVNIPIDSSLFEPPKQDVRDFKFANGKSAENIPFQFIERHIYLNVTINGKTSLWILDSGAGRSVLDSTFAANAGLKMEGNIKGQGVSRVVDVSFTTIPQYSLEGLEIDQQKIMAISLQGLFHKIMGLEVAGILGYDFLSRFVTRIDYAKEQISFYDPDSFSYSGDGTIINAPLSQDNMFHVPMTVDSKDSGLWNLDLGAGNVDFHFPYAESIGLINQKGIDALGFGAGGDMHTRSRKFTSIKFAGFTLDKPIISWPLEKGQGAFSGRELVGNIGNDLLHNFVIYLDYKRGQVIVEKGAAFGQFIPRDNSGLQVGYGDSDQVEVLFASPGTPADIAGLKIGDIVQTINGKPTKDYDGLIAIRKLLREKPGTVYDLNVKREDKTLTLKLVLKDLFE
ncbi:conserved exported hypothetical protein [Candidatus Zixiibacteriota bacterium]|nr:conserved exported hypothetical protein [candidate division Zixibacteria bacterium]